MDKRLFHRVDVSANGELHWATKSRVGRLTKHKEHIRTENVSIDGAKILVPGKHHFPKGARARLKLGIEFCDVEVREAVSANEGTILRLIFISPSARFVAVLEKSMRVTTHERDDFISSWM